jgi:hypothetical protein
MKINILSFAIYAKTILANPILSNSESSDRLYKRTPGQGPSTPIMDWCDPGFPYNMPCPGQSNQAHPETSYSKDPYVKSLQQSIEKLQVKLTSRITPSGRPLTSKKLKRIKDAMNNLEQIISELAVNPTPVASQTTNTRVQFSQPIIKGPTSPV